MRGIRWQCADNDYGRIACGGTASNSGYLEIATADDGNEPIYVRQYTGVFSSLTRTLTLLDASGNTNFPGRISVSNTVDPGVSPGVACIEIREAGRGGTNITYSA